MAWVKNDDRMDDTPKVKKAWRRNRATVGLWSMAKTRSARHESDGLVPLEWIEERLPDTVEREDTLTVLLDVGLFEELPAGETKKVKVTRVRKGKSVDVRVTYGPCDEDSFIVHDYLEFNEARVELEERRRADAVRKTKERKKSPSDDDDSSTPRPPGQTLDSAGTDDGLHAVSASPDPTRPDPTRPDQQLPPNPPAGGRARDIQKWEEETAQWVQAHPPGLLGVEWQPFCLELMSAVGDDWEMFAFDSLHPHAIVDGVWVLGGAHQATQRLHDLGGRGLKVSFVWRFVDCRCELSSERAA